MKPRLRFRWRRLTAVVLLLLAGAAAYALKPYAPDAEALAALQSGSGVSVTDAGAWLRFEPRQMAEPSVILYPGGLVKPESYAPLARALATAGHRTYIVRMPLQLAVLGSDRAAPLLAASPAERFVIGGHSLGGVMASRFAAAHAERLTGVFFLAAYPEAKGSLREAGLPAISLLGTEDGVVKRDRFEQARSLLPAGTAYWGIEGGNHAGFGSYGPQKGDRPARISPQEQARQTAALLTQWMAALPLQDAAAPSGPLSAESGWASTLNGSGSAPQALRGGVGQAAGLSRTVPAPLHGRARTANAS